DRVSIQYADAFQEGGIRLGLQSLLYQANGWPSYGGSLPTGVYTIDNKESGLRLGLPNSVTPSSAGIPVTLRTPSAENGSRWVLSKLLASLFIARNLEAPLNMAITDGSAGVFKPVSAQKAQAIDGQEWIFDQLNDGRYRILSAVGTVLEGPAGVSTPGTEVDTNIWLNTDNQKWTLTKVGN
ncbi:MAG: RICIN domain-containing protein, partial [bacterium]